MLLFTVCFKIFVHPSIVYCVCTWARSPIFNSAFGLIFSISAALTRSLASTTRTVDGPSVNFSYGTLSVAVTVTGSKIVKVGIASLNDDNVPRSESIDQAAIPVLEREALTAQSGNIQSVSGASYTSAGFRTSLQAALRTLGLD